MARDRGTLWRLGGDRPVRDVDILLLDIGIGLAILSSRARRFLGIFQLTLVAAYTLGLSLLMPLLWLDPFGALLKNLPILAAIGVWTALQDDK